MKYFQKTIIASLIVALASFAGGLCTHPMMAQAANSEMGGRDMLQDNIITDSTCITTSNNEASHTINTCTFDCVTKVPQTISTKKVTFDTNASIFIACPIDDQYTHISALSFGAVDSFGVHSPSPDILSSVFKRE